MYTIVYNYLFKMFHFSEKYNLIPDRRNVFIGVSKYNVSIFYSGVMEYILILAYDDI